MARAVYVCHGDTFGRGATDLPAVVSTPQQPSDMPKRWRCSRASSATKASALASVRQHGIMRFRSSPAHGRFAVTQSCTF